MSVVVGYGPGTGLVDVNRSRDRFVRYSLKNLLDFYCGYKADKANQLADWRQRPLSDRMKQYARDDVHYLL